MFPIAISVVRFTEIFTISLPWFILLTTQLLPHSQGILKACMMFFITINELVLDTLNPYYDAIYKILRPSLILTRIILDVVTSIWGCRRGPVERVDHTHNV